MRMMTLVRVFLVSLIAISAFAGPAPAQPVEVTISPDSLLNGLNESDRAQVRDALQFWLRALRAAEDPDRVVTIRGQLLRLALKYPNETYQSFFAQEGAKVLGAIFRDRPETLRQHKEVNLAMVFAELPTVAARHAYREMVFHPNGGVRYLGWRGYRRIRTDILAEGGESAEQFYKLLEKAAAEEDSPIVAEELFAVLTPPAFTATPLPPEALARMRARLLNILGQAWSHWCRVVLRGSAVPMQSLQAGMGAFRRTAAVMGDDADARKAVVQSLANMVWCASKTYLDAQAAGEAAETNEELLLELETALRAISGLDLSPLAARLGTNAPENKDPRMVRVAALEWIESLRKPFGIEDPKDRFAPADGPPATQPGPTT